MIHKLEEYILAQADLLRESPFESLKQCCRILLEARQNNQSVFAIGNGGSAATASHFVNDLVKGLSMHGRKRFKAFCLCDQVPVVTALANDYSYDRIFSEQLENYAAEGDILMMFSGSGNSPNIVQAAEYARTHGMTAIGMTGRSGGKIRNLCTLILQAPTDRMEQVEDIHLTWEHAIICTLRDEIEKEGP